MLLEIRDDATEILFRVLDSIDLDEKYSPLFLPMRVTDEELLHSFLSLFVKDEEFHESIRKVIDTDNYWVIIRIYCGGNNKCVKIVDKVFRSVISR